MSAIDGVLESNAKYAAEFGEGDLPAQPALRIAAVTCMDCRLHMASLGLGAGDAHILRNAGGVVTEDVIRSLVVSQWLLGTREIMLIHDTDCGMQKFVDAELKDRVERETGIRPPFAIETFPDLERDVRQSIARIEASPFLLHKDSIRGFVYEVETGRLREVV